MAVHANSMKNLHHPGVLMDAAERLYARVLPPTPEQLQQVAGLMEGKPDAQPLLQMLGLAPYVSVVKRRVRNSNRKRDHRAEQARRQERGFTKHNANSYKSGCRCAICVDAIREYRATHRPAVIPHGTESGYKNGYCRCDPCRAAAAVASRARREAKKCRALTTV